MADYSWDQIANYLTDGYWASLGQSRASFNPDRTVIYYDISQLSYGARQIASAAFQAWSGASGLKLYDANASTSANQIDFANVDLMNVESNGFFHVFNRTPNSYDRYRIYLDVGTTYTFDLTPENASLNASLRLSGNGVVLQSNQPGATAEHIEFTPTASGFYSLNVYGATNADYDFIIDALPDIVVQNTPQPSPYTQTTKVGSTITHSDVYVNDNGSASSFNGTLFQSYLREIGHALGLGNAGPYNNTATYGIDNIYDNDSWKASAMSLFSQTANTSVAGDLAYLASLMPADIIAIQNLYGPRAANSYVTWSIWGPGGYMPGEYSIVQQKLNMAAGLIPANPLIYNGEAFSFTINDKGGEDTIDMSPFNMAQIINLNELEYSSIAGAVENVVIARGTVIENATGGSAKDILIGNQIANVLSGNRGNDELFGKGGDDTLDGGLGADTMAGGLGDDAYFIDNVGDVVTEAAGDGNGSSDVINSSIALTNVANVEKLFLTGSANLSATGLNSQADWLVGNTGSNTLSGLGGDDILDGGAGIDILIGGEGDDQYHIDNTADSVVEAAGSLSGIDSIFSSISVTNIANVERVYLTGANSINASGLDGQSDELFGNESDNTLIAGSGNDLLAGRAGADHLDGGTDNDTADYRTSSAGTVNISLLADSASGGEAAGDTLDNIENLFGSLTLRDVLIGDNGANVLKGFGGNDSLRGEGGDDYLEGGTGGDALNAGAGVNDWAGYLDNVAADIRVDLTLNTASGGDASGDMLFFVENLEGSLTRRDILIGNLLVNTLVGNGGSDIIRGEAGNDIIEGGTGADSLNAGAGIDTVVYEHSSAGVTVNLNVSLQTSGGEASGDSLFFFENITGSLFEDNLTGNLFSNRLVGGGSADTLNGALGSDYLTGGLDADTFRFQDMSFGTDTILDWEDGVDKISIALPLETSFAGLTVTGNGSSQVVVRGFNGTGSTIIVKADAAFTLDVSDFIFI